MYHKFDVMKNLFFYSALFNGSKHNLNLFQTHPLFSVIHGLEKQLDLRAALVSSLRKNQTIAVNVCEIKVDATLNKIYTLERWVDNFN
jgi:hypothetical protein